jgi:hypothetical protein
MPRRGWPRLVVPLLAFLPSLLAQSTLPVPSLTTLNASQTFSLPVLTSPSTYDLTLSLCSASGNAVEGAELVFVSNDSSITQPSSSNVKDPNLIGVSRGGLASVVAVPASQGLSVAVDLPSGWSAELGVAVNGQYCFVSNAIYRCDSFLLSLSSSPTSIYESPSFRLLRLGQRIGDPHFAHLLYRKSNPILPRTRFLNLFSRQPPSADQLLLLPSHLERPRLPSERVPDDAGRCQTQSRRGRNWRFGTDGWRTSAVRPRRPRKGD